MTYLSIRAAALAIGLLSCSPVWGATTFETIHDFGNGADGEWPETAMTVGPDGNLYGTTTKGGTHGAGTLFRYRFTQAGGEFSVVHQFDPATTGKEPRARLLNIGDGYLYGATRDRGNPVSGAGTVYRLDPFTGNITVVYAISSAGSDTPRKPMFLTSGEPNVLHVACDDYSGIWRVPLDGSDPTVASFRSETPNPLYIMRASDGFLYGGSRTSGAADAGTIFRTNADGTNWTVVHECEEETGTVPGGALVEAEDGFLYGVMNFQGPKNLHNVNGVLYRFNPANLEYKVLHAFLDFDVPSGELLLATDGMLYGVAQQFGPGGNGSGGIFRIKRDGSGYRVLHHFLTTAKDGTMYPTGRVPVGGLVQGPDGAIYGTCQKGPQASSGSIFRLDVDLPAPPINRAPIALADYGFSTGSAVTVSVTANDFDPDGDTLFVSIETQPEFGTAELNSNGSIEYTPNAGYTQFDEFTYKISDQRGGFSVGTVTIRNTAADELFEPGRYNGLVSRDEDLNGPDEVSRGQILLNIQQTGSFTGTLLTENKRIPLRGTFTDNATAVTTVKLPNKTTAVLFLAFQAGPSSTVNAVFFGEENWVGFASPVVLPDISAKQTYTVHITPDSENLPVGFGYGTMTINPNGTIKMIGKLGDGSNFKWASTLVQDEGIENGLGIPFYSTPIKGGYASGGMGLSVGEGEDFNGGMLWRRPPASKSNKPYPLGFNGVAEIRATPFISPGPLDPVLQIPGSTVVLESPKLEAPAQGTFTIDGKKIKAEGDLKSFTINRSTGIFSGAMRAEGKTISFKGAVNQDLRIGLGQFTINGETGRAEFVTLPAD